MEGVGKDWGFEQKRGIICLGAPREVLSTLEHRGGARPGNCKESPTNPEMLVAWSRWWLWNEGEGDTLRVYVEDRVNRIC